jgi:hypothetical protein
MVKFLQISPLVFLMTATSILLTGSCATPMVPKSPQLPEQSFPSQSRPTVVCNNPYKPCSGIYGSACYWEAKGETCHDGFVCGFGLDFCDIPRPQCYRPGSQTCG